MKEWKIILTVTVIFATSGFVFADGVAGSALQFDGTDDFAFVTDNATLDITGPITVETWLQLSSRGSIKLAVGKRLSYFIYCEMYDAGSSGEWKGSLAYVGAEDWFEPTNLQVDQWYHLAMTYDQTNVRLFVNGDLKVTAAASGALVASDYNLTFGDDMVDRIYPLHGLMDEIRLWNIARTPEEISANYNRIIDPLSAGLVGYWQFDEGGGQIAYDETINGNNALLGATAAAASDDPQWVASDAPLILPGDVNGDGYVSGLDLTTIVTNWGMNPATREQGDLSGDGFVTGHDYTEVVSYWGTGTPPPEPPSGIPEPATLGLLIMGGLAILRRRSR